MENEMLTCRVTFSEFKCRIEVEYHCFDKKSINMLYLQISKRTPIDVFSNFKNASEILKQWKANEYEIEHFRKELFNPDKLNEVNCGIQRAFTINP